MDKSDHKNIVIMLKSRAKIAEQIIIKSRKYIDVVKDVIVGTNPQEYYSIIKQADIAQRYCAEWMSDKNDFKDTAIQLQNMSETYNRLAELDAILRHLVDLMHNDEYGRLAIYNMSTTYATNINHERNSAYLLYEKYLTDSLQDDGYIFEIVMRQYDIKKAEHVDLLFKFVITALDNPEKITINKFIIKIIASLIVVLSGERRRRLELIIEQQKDIVLGAGRAVISHLSGVHGSIVRCGLKPVTPSMSMASLFKQFGAIYEYKLTAEENFARIDEGVIILNRTTSSPVEFDLRGLTDLQYITENNLKIKPNSGLTNKVMQKYNTARLLKQEQKTSAPPQIYHGRVNKWYVFETIDGGRLFRMLSREGIEPVSGESIIGLVSGLSLRPQQYNKIHAEDILQKCHDPKSQLILATYEETKTVPLSSEPLRVVIVDNLAKQFAIDLAKNHPTTVVQLRNLIINDRVIGEILLEVLTHAGIKGKGADEFMITYIAKYESIARDFVKTLDRKWNDAKIDDRLFKEYSGADLRKILDEVFRNVVRAAVDELEKTKVWTEYDMTLKEFYLHQEQIVV